MPLFSRKRNRSSSPATANANPSGRSSVADAPSPASPGSASTTRSNGKPSAASSATGDTAAIVASSPAAQEALRAALAARKSVFNPVDPAIEQEIRTIGGNLLDLARGKKSGVFSSQFWSDKLMDWAMQDEAFKIQFFRFVDTFPSLKTPDQVHDHLVDYLSQPGVTPPPGMDLGIKAGGMAKGLFTKQMTSRITGMAQKFIAGQDAASSVDQLRKLWKQNIGFTVDLLGEACISARLADEYLEKYLDLVNNLPQQVSDFPSNPRLESDYLGPIPRVNVSIKLTSLFWNVDPIAPERSIDALMERVAPILIAAKKKGVFINFDVEQFEYKEMTLDLVERACEKYDFEAGLAMQAYLRSGPDDARRVINWAKRVGRQVTVRLVKGAYWDYETINAERMGHPVPVWSRKPETDASFERMVTMFIENMPRSKDEGGVKLALGSHNARSIAHALATAKKHGLPDNAVELQMLHGMGDQLKYAVSEMGLRLREYVPVGEMVVGMAYFVRRLLENTSNESWLRAGFSDNADASVLLANPLDKVPADEPDPGITLITTAPERHQLTPAVPGLGNERPFASEPWRDFARREVRDVFAAAVESASVGGGSDRASPFNGSNGNGAASAAAASDARDSVAAAAGTREAWAATPPIVRSRVLIRAAEHLRRRRDEIAARLICVTGKTWRDADVEVCDAIDALEYYARLGVARFTPGRLGRYIGEMNETARRPRGVVAVITPWNFPLAIPALFIAPALAAGNTVVFKPASATRPIARMFYDILQQSMQEIAAEGRDIPAHRETVHVLNFVPGPGSVVGPAIVQDPRVSTVAFAGSRAVAEAINEGASIVADGSTYHYKNLLCYTGGHNAVIVDASADLGEAVTAVRNCAFGFAGQQATACRRVLVHTSAFDAFLDKLCESTAEMKIGDPRIPGTLMGPMISEEAQRTVLEQVEAIKSDTNYTPVLAADLPPADQLATGWSYVAPQILMERLGNRATNSKANAGANSTNFYPGTNGGNGTLATLAPTTAASADGMLVADPLDDWEIFGPVLGVVEVADFAEGLAIANRSGYRLTGGVFSRKPSNINLARTGFRVGSLYINNPITHGRVGRQPLGGLGLAGHGLECGGPQFLDHFVSPATVIENTMRRGFAPDL